jgi:hypothetical protein
MDNSASIYGDILATEPKTLRFRDHNVQMQTAFIPGLEVLRVFISVYDDFGNQIKRPDLVCKSRVCRSSPGLADCSDLNSLVAPQFHLMDDAGAFVIVKSDVPCSIGADGVYIQALLVSYENLQQSLPSVRCSPCSKGQSITVDTGNKIWYCVTCASNQYVLDPNNASVGCQNCPRGAVCDGSALIGRVDGSVWERDYNLGQYRLVSCPPGYEISVYTGADMAFAYMNQQCSKCSSNQFILNSSFSKHRCQDCPIGASCDGSSLHGVVPGSIWRADMVLGQYFLDSCPPGYEVSISDGVDSYFSYLNQQCLLCKAGWYCLGGTDSSNMCLTGTFSSPGANSSGACTTAMFVQINLLLPIKKSYFADKETDFKLCFAEAFQTLQYNIMLDEIIPRVYRRATNRDAIEVQCRIAVKDQSQASGVIERAKNPDLSRALLLSGLPPCEILLATILPSGTDTNPVQLNNLILALGIIIGALLLLGTVLCWTLTKRRTESKEAITLRMKISEIRSKLLIERKNGFILQNERVPFLTKTKFVFINTGYVEAAARIEMNIDFEVRHFDAFCHCFESDTVGMLSERVLMNNVSTPQYNALCLWLLNICKELIDPNSSGKYTTDYSDSTPKNSRERFAYFEKISKAQIWKNYDGKLFKEVKGIANEFMERISLECDARYEKICHEAKGYELMSLPSWPSMPLDPDSRTARIIAPGGIRETPAVNNAFVGNSDSLDGR